MVTEEQAGCFYYFSPEKWNLRRNKPTRWQIEGLLIYQEKGSGFPHAGFGEQPWRWNVHLLSERCSHARHRMRGANEAVYKVICRVLRFCCPGFKNKFKWEEMVLNRNCAKSGADVFLEESSCTFYCWGLWPCRGHSDLHRALESRACYWQPRSPGSCHCRVTGSALCLTDGFVWHYSQPADW